MECMNLQISSATTSLELVVIYRPPPSTKNKLTSNLFFSELSSLLETGCVASSNIVMAEDFNIHVDDDEDHDASVFLETIDLRDLKQHVNKPTHKRNHTLDLLISRKDSNLVTNPSVVGGLPSDHFAVKCILNIACPKPSVKRVICRSLRKIKDFNNDIIQVKGRRAGMTCLIAALGKLPEKIKNFIPNLNNICRIFAEI